MRNGSGPKRRIPRRFLTKAAYSDSFGEEPFQPGKIRKVHEKTTRAREQNSYDRNGLKCRCTASGANVGATEDLGKREI